MFYVVVPIHPLQRGKIFARKIFSSKCVLFVADGQAWAGDVAWKMRTMLPPVQISSSVFQLDIYSSDFKFSIQLDIYSSEFRVQPCSFDHFCHLDFTCCCLSITNSTLPLIIDCVHGIHFQFTNLQLSKKKKVMLN